MRPLFLGLGTIPQIRVKAAEILGKIGSDNPDVQAALQKAASDKNETVRQAAEETLAGTK